MIPLQPDSTVGAMRTKVRRLTVSSSEQTLPTAVIDQALNTFINQDFPYAIKLDQMRSVYNFYTAPNIDRYPLNVNYNQGIRSPVYFEGVQGFFYKDRQEFLNLWPRWPTITNMAAPTTIPFSYTIQTIPFLGKEVTIGMTDSTGKAIQISDDGNGNLYYRSANPIVPVPPFPNPLPGMPNNNLSNVVPYGLNNYQTYPGDIISSFVGTVSYVTGAVTINLALVGLTVEPGSMIWTKVSQYEPGRPYSLLIWNNEFTVRPVPNGVYKVEVETYLTPVQFLESTDVPILTQWWQYVSYGAAIEILRERQDFEGVGQLMEGFKRQEALVLERQGVEEINQRNATIFSAATPQQGWNGLQGWPY